MTENKIGTQQTQIVCCWRKCDLLFIQADFFIFFGNVC